jgi:uncharacterized cysteine cluster protein YcgN (CxxCxxCC family)
MFDPFGIDLVTNWRGAIAAGVNNGGLESTHCEVATHYANQHDSTRVTEAVCVEMDWSEPNTAYRRAPVGDPRSWFGTLLTDKKDASGLLYMRNRYCDPQSGK